MSEKSDESAVLCAINHRSQVRRRCHLHVKIPALRFCPPKNWHPGSLSLRGCIDESPNVIEL
jgi:hypothetical protein